MDLPIGDIYEALYAQLETSDRIFEFWLGATFAVIVATFLASDRITRTMYLLVSFLYGVVSINFMFRYYVSGLKFQELRHQLLDAGEFLPGGLPAIAVVVLTWFTFVAGTIAALYFVWHTHSRNRTDKQ